MSTKISELTHFHAILTSHLAHCEFSEGTFIDKCFEYLLKRKKYTQFFQVFLFCALSYMTCSQAKVKTKPKHRNIKIAFVSKTGSRKTWEHSFIVQFRSNQEVIKRPHCKPKGQVIVEREKSTSHWIVASISEFLWNCSTEGVQLFNDHREGDLLTLPMNKSNEWS